MEILNNVLSGNANMQAIKNQLFDVVKVPLITNLEGFEAPNNFGMYKAEGGNCLGVVGKDYTPTPSKLLFEQFEDCLYDTDADFNKVKYLELKEGRKIVFEAPIKNMGFRNMVGKEDELIVKVNLSTGYDGLTKTSLFVSVYRLICSNGMKAWNTEFNVAFKNTQGNVGKASSLCADVAKAIDSTERYGDLIKQLNKTEVSVADTQEFLKRVLGYNNSMLDEVSTRGRNILDAVQESIAIEFSRTGATAWGLVNGITHYTNHVVNTKEDRDSYLLVGSGMKLNDTAQRVALSLI